jgi:EAL domain-containing protein (putative c-di-GMP-specific phosphodiesterase class I)/GGDEF domain-containing protein
MTAFFSEDSSLVPLPSEMGVSGMALIHAEEGGYPAFLVERLQQVIDERDPNNPAALVLISIDNMPMMISGFGHKATEDAVRGLLYALKDYFSSIDPTITISRAQKDQIAIIVLQQQDARFDDVTQGIARHVKNFSFESDYGFIHVLASVASIALPRSVVAADDILNQAYIAIKSEKSVQSAEFEPALQNASSSRQEMNMVNYITRTIRDGQFCMAFQPIVSSKTGEVEHYEALLRVLKPTGELNTAGPLIPVAERMGLIDIIDEMVLDKMVEELLAAPQLKLSFNVSNLTANSTAWLRKFAQVAKDYPEVVSRMMVEITETAVHLDLRRTAYFVVAVQAHGASVALDDFGSGYTSFRQLKSLSVDIIKIDGVFVKDLTDNHDNVLFIKTMLDFTNGFGLETVAEFVENGETAKILMELGVHYMQGYYFGFPAVKRAWMPV